MNSKTKNGFEFDSFDRFGDDLCEVLISYLSISDKIRLECVSKQWKNLIFNKQNIIFVNYNVDPNNSIIVPINITSDVKLFEKILQKFRFIEEIFTITSGATNNSCKIFGALINNCNHLKIISSSGDVSDSEVMTKFVQNCGQNLKSIYLNSSQDQDLIKILRLTPNLELIHNPYKNFYFYNEIYFSKLKEIYFSRELNLNQFKSFTSLYHNQIEKMCLQFDSEMNNFLVELSTFQNLQNLVIFITSFMNQTEAIANALNPNKSGLILIANKCKKLKIFKFESLFGGSFISNDKNLCELFSGFNALEKLSLCQKFNQQNKSIIKPLKNCEKLKYLELSLPSNGKALEYFELYLPNLKTVFIHLEFDSKSDSEIFQHLANSKSLTKLVISFSYCIEIIDSLIIDVLRSCRNIREIYFDGKNQFKITRNTLDLLDSYTKSNFKFNYDFNHKHKKSEKYWMTYKSYYTLYIKNW
jgi:hypothetical protein